MSKIWEDMLGLDRVGITDNFFHLGGNSILAIQASHRMSKMLRYDIGGAVILMRLNSVLKLGINLILKRILMKELIFP